MEVPLDSLQVHSDLNPQLWDNFQLRPYIRKSLLRITADFLVTLEAEALPLDVTITGSLANFNYFPESDLDLHILFNFNDISEDGELARQMLMAKKALWNLKHNITIKGHDVEIYPQDINEEHHSAGVYSVLNDDWIVRPQPSNPIIDTEAVVQKVHSLANLIDSILASPDRRMFIPSLREKLSNMRKAGLSSKGEYSVENLTFKLLRRHGYIDRIMDADIEDRDITLSVAQEGSTMKIKRSELMKVLSEELSEIENPRHRGGSHDRTQVDFNAPDDLLLDTDNLIDAPAVENPQDSGLATAVLAEINSLASRIATALESRSDVPDWVGFKLGSSLTNLRDIEVYVRGAENE